MYLNRMLKSCKRKKRTKLLLPLNLLKKSWLQKARNFIKDKNKLKTCRVRYPNRKVRIYKIA